MELWTSEQLLLSTDNCVLSTCLPMPGPSFHPNLPRRTRRLSDRRDGGPRRENIAGGNQDKAESIATAQNSLLYQLTAVPDLEVAVAGYRGDCSGADVGCRLGRSAGRATLRPHVALATTPLAVETRVRRVPAKLAGGREESVRFPVWYVPELGESVFPVLGYGYCRHLVVSESRRTWLGAGRRW